MMQPVGITGRGVGRSSTVFPLVITLHRSILFCLSERMTKSSPSVYSADCTHHSSRKFQYITKFKQNRIPGDIFFMMHPAEMAGRIIDCLPTNVALCDHRGADPFVSACLNE